MGAALSLSGRGVLLFVKRLYVCCFKGSDGIFGVGIKGMDTPVGFTG